MASAVTFFLNGKPVTIHDPAPDLLLIDYLRSPQVGLAGPKKSCGQGGCGACTVILSRWDGEKPEHRAINSCLRPVCALGGLVVTTIEGTGAVRRPNPQFLRHSLVASRAAAPLDAPTPPAVIQAENAARAKYTAVLESVHEAQEKREGPPLLKLGGAKAAYPSEVTHEGMNPVAYELALNNGSQCGYCSVGFVMNMSEFITNYPRATKKEIEDAFDGNICRCTGYRSILTGMKTFASNWTKEDEDNRMKCLLDPGSASQKPADVVIPFPLAAHQHAQPVTSEGAGQAWLTPVTLDELARAMYENRAGKIRLVHGNTSFGVYKNEFPATQLFIDIRLIPDLSAPPVWTEAELIVAAGATYNDLIGLLQTAMEERGLPETSRIGASWFMARRTAGRIVRNAASLAGNTMMVLHHIADGTGEPFPSDLFTVLDAIGVKIDYLELVEAKFENRSAGVAELVAAVANDASLPDRIVLVAYHLPVGGANEVVLAQKVAMRDVNAHSIVNTASVLEISADSVLTGVTLAYGGIAPYPWRAVETEAALTGTTLGLSSIAEAARILEREVRDELNRWKARMRGLPSEGFTDEYRIQLAVSFLYKAAVNAMEARGLPVAPEIASSGIITWGHWPESDGRQYYVTQDWKKPVAQPYIKVTAMYQTSGQIHYTQELPTPPLTVNAAFVQSRRPLANYRFVIPGGSDPATPDQMRAHLSQYASSFVDLITADNIKNGGINYQGMAMDQPLFSPEMVNFAGQSIALVAATTEQEAIRIAEYVTGRCVAYSPVDWPAPWNEPIIGLEDAIEKGSVFPDTPKSASFVSHIWKITRPGSEFGWVREKKPLDGAPMVREMDVSGIHCTVVENSQRNGGQAHFYMETQACVAEPEDERRFIVHPSSQSPMEMHHTTAMALGVHYNQIDVR